MCEHVHMRAGVLGGQKRVGSCAAAVVVRCWALNLGHLQEQSMLLSSEPTLQPPE